MCEQVGTEGIWLWLWTPFQHAALCLSAAVRGRCSGSRAHLSPAPAL